MILVCGRVNARMWGVELELPDATGGAEGGKCGMPGSLALRQQPQQPRPNDRLSAATDLQFSVDVPQMCFDRGSR